jgi:hypothetical protein
MLLRNTQRQILFLGVTLNYVRHGKRHRAGKNVVPIHDTRSHAQGRRSMSTGLYANVLLEVNGVADPGFPNKPAGLAGRCASGADVSAEEQTIRLKVLQTLPDGFDQGLATRRATGDRSTMLQNLKQVRVVVEAAVLEEIRLQTLAEGEDFPPLFRALFDGKGQPDGWFDLFVRDAAAKIKDGTEFKQIWNAEQTALIKTIVAAHWAVLDRLDERTDRTDRRTELMQQDLAELLALARSGGVYRRAAEQGISEAAVREIVERLGGDGIGRDDLIPWLDNWIEAATRELGRQSNEGEAFEVAWREAEKRFKAGRISEASSAFMEEFEREDRREAERQHEHKRRQIRLLEGSIRFDALAFDAPAIIPKLRLMANIEGVANGDALGEWLTAKAKEAYSQGADKGSNPDLGSRW